MQKYSVIPFEFDSRMVEWNMKNNLITKDQLEKFVKALPDDAANAEVLEIEDATVISTEPQNH